jgi:excinuclease ABC subunit A
VGLNYLSLDRSADTLSGGEAQRIRLASQIGSGLTGVMYVLDEPSIGLHQRDNDRLIGTLQAPARPGQQRAGGRARRGHDPRRRPRGRHGPGAGVHGGRVMAQGTPEEVAATPTRSPAQYLAARAQASPCRPARRRRPDNRAAAALRIVGARGQQPAGVTSRSRSAC